MARGILLYAALVVVLTIGALASGCGDDDATVAPSKGKVDDAPKKPEPKQADALALDKEWWGRRPAVRIFLTGGQRGLLKPCGCTSPQLGGLQRAASVLYQIQRRAAPKHPGGPAGVVRSISLGWSMRGAGEEQAEAKADYLRAVHEALGYSATLLGDSDLDVPAMCQPRGTGVDMPHPPLNIRLIGTNPAAETVPFADFGAGELKVRAFSVLDPERAESLVEGGAALAVMSATQALSLTPKPDTLWIAAVRSDSEDLAREVQTALKRLGPGVIVDVSAGGAGGAHKIDHVPVGVGQDPVIVGLGEFGKAVGVLDLDPASGGAGWVLSYRRIDLVPQWEKYGGEPAQTVKALDGIYREVVQARGYLARFVRGADGKASYVGSSACAQCHAAIYKDWRRSPHSLALETLEKQNYHWDPECIRCHVVGWQRVGPESWYVTESAFRTPDRTPFLGGVGCENCHGPGSLHVEDPWDLSLFDAGGPNVTKPGQQDTCVPCHDVENSHGFLERYERHYLPNVDHRTVPADIKTAVPDDWEPRGAEPAPKDDR